MKKKAAILFTLLTGGLALLMIGAFWLRTGMRQEVADTLNLRKSSEHFTQILIPSQNPPFESRDTSLQAVYQAPLSDQLAFVLGQKGDGKYQTRLAALRRLSHHLNGDDLEALSSFLAESKPVVKLKPEETAALKNDLMNLLRNQVTPPAGLTDLLLKVSQDQAQPEVMRDYALQHLSQWCQEEGGREDQARVEDSFWKAAMGREQSLPGTSLLALYRFSGQEKNFDQNRLRQMASGIAQDPSEPVSAQITAFQVCAMMKLKEVAPEALRIAQTGSSPLPLRISAIAALGSLGTEGKPFLHRLAEGADPILRVPAQAALKRMEGAGS